MKRLLAYLFLVLGLGLVVSVNAKTEEFSKQTAIIERVKELIVYDELTLSEIAFQLHYSSVAYLSNQFKKATGMTPTQFKKSVDKNRKSLDEI